MILRICFCLSLIFLMACDNEPATQKKAPVQSKAIAYPVLPKLKQQDLFRKTISIDIIAYELGISMSYNDPGSIQPVLAFLTQNPCEIPSTCKAVGRVSFMYETGVGEEAEMYIHDGCRSFVWLEDGKKKYGNQLTHEGLDFFTRFIPENPADFKLPENGTSK